MKNKSLIINLVKKIRNIEDSDISIMEICGTHTQSISQYGIRELLYPKIKLISGPGCPVCVTSEAYIDSCIELLKNKEVIIATFGDLVKVNGKNGNLLEQSEQRQNVRVVYSPMDALKIAMENSNRQIVFLAVGFETTAPLIAVTIKTARIQNIKNFSILCALKTMKPVIQKILSNKDIKINGMICPGHVAVIKGAEHFRFITEEYNIPAVVCGFDELNILSGIYFLVKQKKTDKKQFENLYRTCVTSQGNLYANDIIDEVFFNGDMEWRGIGKIDKSGLYVKDKYADFDAAKRFNICIKEMKNSKCVCGDIILGKKLPYDCGFFGKKCTPESAVGPCMVSSEGTCSVYYKYGRWKIYESCYKTSTR